MGDIPDIDPGDGGGVDETATKKPAPRLAPTGAHCLSCDAEIVGPYCAVCGQKNDDMRRSSLLLFRDFIEDTFAFDSRMWKTLALMASKPGHVPTHYSHGRRSRYTPPVRLFLVVSFLFFLALGLTQTMFIAMEVTEKTPEEIVAEKARRDSALAGMDERTRATALRAKNEEGAIVIDGEDIDCNINVGAKFFVRAENVTIDEDLWRKCSQSFASAANKPNGDHEVTVDVLTSENEITGEEVREGLNRVIGGLDVFVSDPQRFNESINTWLPRVMFFMAPVLALLLGLFIRGRDALFFDHLVLSLYSHATGFAVFGAAIILGQFGVPQIFPVAVAALGVYFILALKRAYGRGWIKTVWTSLAGGLLYLIILVSIVGAIIANEIWTVAA